MEKITKNEMAQTIVAADFRLSLASIHAGMDNKFSEVAREVRKVSRRPLSQVEAEYRDACASMKKRNAGDCTTCNIAPNSERVAEGKARVEKDNEQTAREISDTPAMKAATAREQESERVRREVKTPEAWDAEAVKVIEDAGTTQVAEHNREEIASIRSRAAFLYSYATTINGINSSLRDMLNSISHEVKMGQVPSALFLEACRAVILEQARRADKAETAALKAQIKGMEDTLAEEINARKDAEARAKTLASDANKAASALAAESRQHEQTRQKLQEATVRACASIKAYVVVNKAELREMLKKINGRGDCRTGSIALEVSMSKEYKSVGGAYQAQIKGITSTR